MMSNRPDHPLVIFDVCDTLYDANTTFDFLRFHAEESANGALRRALRSWTSFRSVRGLLAAATLRLTGIDLARARVIHALRGEMRTALMKSALGYVQTVLPARANPAVQERLREHRDAGHRVVLVSSSLDIVIQEIAKVLGVEFRSSILEFVNDRCTGRLQTDLTGRKARAAADLRRGETSLHVYTDNRTDIDLLKFADRRTVIVPAGADQHQWAGANCEYVRL